MSKIGQNSAKTCFVKRIFDLQGGEIQNHMAIYKNVILITLLYIFGDAVDNKGYRKRQKQKRIELMKI